MLPAPRAKGPAGRRAAAVGPPVAGGLQGRATPLADRIRVRGLLASSTTASRGPTTASSCGPSRPPTKGCSRSCNPDRPRPGTPCAASSMLSLAALQQLVLLERPGAEAVTVVAEGGVFWATPDGDEQRAARREFTAPLPSR